MPDGMRIHLVGPGDTLRTIAAKYYGNPARWVEVFNANKGYISHPNRLFAGQVIRVP